MRCFIAIDLNEQVKKGLEELQVQLRSKARLDRQDVTWVKPENTHLTLKFLGEIEDESAADVCGITEAVAKEAEGFEVAIEQVGHFGGRSARVVWVGAGEGSDRLLALQQMLEKRLAEAGYPPEERPFSAHLTICRVKNPRAGVKLAEIAGTYKDFKLGALTVDSIVVYRSVLSRTGSIYTVLGRYELK